MVVGGEQFGDLSRVSRLIDTLDIEPDGTAGDGRGAALESAAFLRRRAVVVVVRKRSGSVACSGTSATCGAVNWGLWTDEQT